LPQKPCRPRRGLLHDRAGASLAVLHLLHAHKPLEGRQLPQAPDRDRKPRTAQTRATPPLPSRLLREANAECGTRNAELKNSCLPVHRCGVAAFIVSSVLPFHPSSFILPSCYVSASSHVTV